MVFKKDRKSTALGGRHSLLLSTHTSDNSHLYEQETEVVNKAVDHSRNFDKKADWLEIPEDVSLCIADKFVDVRDIIRLGAVCVSWRPVYIEKRALVATSQQIPMLLINDNHSTRSLYSVTENRVLNYEVRMSQDLYCAGSSHGWLVTVSKDYKICLVNPLMAVNNEIVLPHLTSFTIDLKKGEDYYRWGVLGFLEKVVLSANPASNLNFIALAFYGGSSRLAYFKPGIKAWTSLSFDYALIMDIIYFENRFYAVSGEGQVYILDFNSSCLEVSRLDVPPLKTIVHKRYLVESRGDLLQVFRHTLFDHDVNDDDDVHDRGNYFNNGFDVYKLDGIGKNWNKITKLSGHSLFLGLNTSLSILASDFPRCKPNSIYYTDDYVEGWKWGQKEPSAYLELHDNGMFNIEDRSTEQHYPTKAKRTFHAQIWIQPTL